MVKIIAETISKRLLPKRSAKKPKGKLKMTPASGEKKEIKPKRASLPPRPFLTKRGRTGLFEIVVEKMPRKPMRQR
jgi:hypothetical protein